MKQSDYTLSKTNSFMVGFFDNPFKRGDQVWIPSETPFAFRPYVTATGAVDFKYNGSFKSSGSFETPRIVTVVNVGQVYDYYLPGGKAIKMPATISFETFNSYTKVNSYASLIVTPKMLQDNGKDITRLNENTLKPLPDEYRFHELLLNPFQDGERVFIPHGSLIETNTLDVYGNELVPPYDVHTVGAMEIEILESYRGSVLPGQDFTRVIPGSFMFEDENGKDTVVVVTEEIVKANGKPLQYAAEGQNYG